jgi:ABC-type phosphate transport system ATPase subunit
MGKRIDIRDLNVYYGAFKAVEDVSTRSRRWPSRT